MRTAYFFFKEDTTRPYKTVTISVLYTCPLQKFITNNIFFLQTNQLNNPHYNIYKISAYGLLRGTTFLLHFFTKVDQFSV